MDPQMMASGGGQPPSQGTNPQTQISPGNAMVANPQKIVEAIKAVVQQCVDSQGFVDMNKVVQMWPQIAQQMGINIPFQVVMQMMSQHPEILDAIIQQMGLAGVIKDGQRITSEQLMGMSNGANSPMQQGAPPQGMGG